MTNLVDGYQAKSRNKDTAGVSRWLIVLIFLIPIVIYLPGIFGKIPFPSESALYSDLMLTHYPNALYLKNSILEFQQIPLWSTFIHSGSPFAANPLAGLFYLPGWLAILFPLPAGISVILAAHAVFATWGMYLFLKDENIGELSAIAGGLIMGLMPKVAAHYGAGHVSLIYAISWTPWLFLVSRNDQKGWKTGIIAALLFLADPRWAVYAGLMWVTYDIAHRHNIGLKALAIYYLKSGITALLIASPIIIPLYEFVGLSTRPKMVVEDILTHSLSPEKILGLIIPKGGGNPEWVLYSGGIVFGLTIFQVFVKQVRRDNKFWNIWVLISLLFSFGSWWINPDWFINIPILSLLRVPARALFLVGFSLAVIAARSIDFLGSSDLDINNISKIAFGIGLTSLGLAVPISFLLGEISLFVIWGFGFLFILSILILVKRIGFSAEKWSWAIMGLIVIDLLGAGLQSYHLKDLDKNLPEILAWIEEDPDNFRIYSPSYSLPQYLAVDNGIELADGVDPLQLTDYSEFMAKATGVTTAGYSVTIPSFRSGNPAIDNISAVPDAFLLSLINVKYVISEFTVENSNLQEIITNDQQYLYRNNYLSERAWVEQVPNNYQEYQNEGLGHVQNIELTPNRIHLLATGPGKLVLSEVFYPGWKVMVDGEKKTVEKAYGLLRGVYLSEGEHEVEFYFQPLPVYFGIGLAWIGWIIALWQILKNNDD